MHSHCQGRDVSSRASLKHALCATVLFGCAVLTSGCWNGRVLFAMEESYWAAEGGGALLHRSLFRASFAHGYFPGFLLIRTQEDPVASLRRELTIHHYRAAVVGPLLSLDPQVFTAVPPSTRLLLVDGASAAAPPGNMVRLVFDRREAFRIAGSAAGLAIRHQAGGTLTNALASRIGVLLSIHPSGTEEELSAFMAGVAQALDGGQPSIRSLSDPVDRNAVQSAIEQMRRDGVEIFLLFMGAPDSWALDTLRNAGGSAIVSDWAPSRAFPAQVFLSVDTDLAGGVARFLAQAHTGEGIVSGPVRIVAGKALPIPSEVAAQVAAR